MRRAVQERFWQKVDKRGPNECWEWRDTPATVGYGMLGLGARKEGKVYAHRLSYELHHGPIPRGHYVCHECDNRLCVNPAHLTAAPPAYNAAGMVERGRSAKGEGHSQVKLTEDQVRAIRSDTRSEPKIAREYGVTRSAIAQIKHRRTWKHVT